MSIFPRFPLAGICGDLSSDGIAYGLTDPHLGSQGGQVLGSSVKGGVCTSGRHAMILILTLVSISCLSARG